MSRIKQFTQWKTIIVYDDSKKETIEYDLDENQKLKKKFKRQKKRSLLFECALSSNEELKQTVLEKITGKRKETKNSIKIITSIIEDDQVDSLSNNVDNDNNMFSFSTNRIFYGNLDLDIFNEDNPIEIESFEELNLSYL